MIFALLTLPALKKEGIYSQSSHIRNLENVIDGRSFVADGKVIKLWGIKAVDQDNPYSYASRMYLETILNESAFICEKRKANSDENTMTCFSQGIDIAAMLLRQGLAYADEKISDKLYIKLQEDAHTHRLGLWKK